MLIVVGSQRESKIEAVCSVLLPDLPDAQVVGAGVSSGVSDQPLTLDETLRGASNRAREAYRSTPADLGVGLEGGVFEVEGTGTIYQICAAALWDGIAFSTGFSPSFEIPREVYDCICEKACDLNEALLLLGYTENREIGASKGAVGLLSGDRMNRMNFMMQALQMAHWIKIGHSRVKSGEVT